ncbi:hypothetical protein DSO57_1007836 [Entomophthora muscae]|uniref:Uncharacterized protein n=2 Tax=Entomophthora muscae TaxID=34485 RepID=A0ACC2RYD9_9FUNG|nr:hypothetical protein DSO57_1007836 [Entomophthora muscae]
MSGTSVPTQANLAPASPACSSASSEAKRAPNNKGPLKDKNQATGRQGKNFHEAKTFADKGRLNSKPQRKRASNPSSSKPQRPQLAHSPDAEDLLLSSRKKGRGNLNHLLQFTLPPRQAHSPQAFRKARFSKSSSIPFNKYRYMNANFRFLVRSTGSYLLQLTDPDDYVEWMDVQQVVVTTTEELNCPICLSVPTAPRMTACGHVYCLPCVLRYLNQATEAEARAWRKCPICYDPVYSKALKPVVTYHAPAPPKPPCNMNFRLLYRRKDSTVTLPTYEGLPMGELPWDTTPGALKFTGLARSTARRLADHLKADKEALIEALQAAKSDGELEEARFIAAAQADVAVSLASIPSDQPHLLLSQEEDSRDLHQFYRSEDGQHIYLLPLHSRILFDYLQEEGNVPASISLPVAHYEESTVNEEMRKRFKNLSFLPLGCDVAFVDLDLESFVKPEILQNYQAPLEARSRHLKAKIRAERKAELRVNSNSFSSLEPFCEAPAISIGSEDFPEMIASSASFPPPSVDSSNWAAMATRTRDSRSDWTISTSEEQYYAPRPNRTLADDFELALSESLLALDALDVKGQKGSKKGKKKLVLLSSNVQRRR